MAPETVGLLEVEYIERVLDAAGRDIPAEALAELKAAALGVQLVANGSPLGAVGIGCFNPGRRILEFWGPLVKATLVGQLPVLVAHVFAQAFLWLRQDPRWDRPYRCELLVRSWGLNSHAGESEPTPQ